jgi:hypothetical protein
VKELETLIQTVEDLPCPECKEALRPQLQTLQESHIKRGNVLGLIQEAVGQLRVDMKYLMFDLEATRRERDEFKAKLDKQG